MDCGDVPPRDPLHLTDHHALALDYLLFNTLDVLAIADWQWQTRFNTLLVRTISLVATARALSVDSPAHAGRPLAQALLECVPGQAPSPVHGIGVR